MRLICALLLSLKVASSKDALCCQASNEDGTTPEAIKEAAELSVSLMQRSFSIVPADHSGSAVGSTDLIKEPKSLHDQLHLAKQARHKLDKQIAALEAELLASQKAETVALGQSSDPNQEPSKLTEPALYAVSAKNVQMGVLSLVGLLTVFYIARTISSYEASRNDKKNDPPWYLSPCMPTVLSAGGLLWLVIGMIMFTEFMWFTDDSRHLTVVESLYVTAQIVTTVGYGDLTPTHSFGKMFMAFYALTGVAIIGTLVQQLIADMVEDCEEKACDSIPDNEPTSFLGMKNKYHKGFVHALPVVASIAFGTAFFSLYPGEDKTVVEAFYMSVITLLTIGFGAYHPVTQVGKAVGTLWMLIGVVIMGSAICGAAEWMMKQQAKIKSQSRALKLFKEFDQDGSGTVDKSEFLAFEMVRNGLAKKTANDAVAKFAELDKDVSGTLTFEEFEAYVLSCDFK
jgi:hypothetical protein